MIGKTFFQIKSVLVLLSILEKNSITLTGIAKATDTTITHVKKTVTIFEKLGLVKTKKSGRVRNVYITEEGRSIALQFKRIIQKLTKLEKVKCEWKKKQ